MEDWIKDFRENLEKKINGEIIYKAKLEKYTSFKIGGPCEVLMIPKDTIELKLIGAFIKKHNLSCCIIGEGTNILFPPYFPGIVLKLGEEFKYLELENKDLIRVGAAVLLEEVVRFAAEKGIGGFEWLIGIPGTIGGAVKGNAGAFGRAIGEIIESIRLFNLNTLDIELLEKKDIKFEYRTSNIPSNYMILGAMIRGKRREKKEILKDMNEFLSLRQAKHPKEPSLGSVFKNFEDVSAGELIEKAGFKGLRRGGAKVSEKHANFIVNENNASYEDVVGLINYIKKGIKRLFNRELKEEIIIIPKEGSVKWEKIE